MSEAIRIGRESGVRGVWVREIVLRNPG